MTVFPNLFYPFTFYWRATTSRHWSYSSLFNQCTFTVDFLLREETESNLPQQWTVSTFLTYLLLQKFTLGRQKTDLYQYYGHQFQDGCHEAIFCVGEASQRLLVHYESFRTIFEMCILNKFCKVWTWPYIRAFLSQT